VLEERNPMDSDLSALVARLQVMPVSDPRARSAILARVRGRRQAPWRVVLVTMWEWQPSVPLLAAAALALVALGAGFAGRALISPAGAPSIATAPTAAADASGGLVPVSNDGVRRVARQFVLEAMGATKVALVGDFNGWDATATVLSDPTGRGVWEGTVLLAAGRHTYAFLVNDSLWVPDPRAPHTTDPDFGRASSVILVPDR
jgi:hypothetical protein